MLPYHSVSSVKIVTQFLFPVVSSVIKVGLGQATTTKISMYYYLADCCAQNTDAIDILIKNSLNSFLILSDSFFHGILFLQYSEIGHYSL